MFPNRSVALFGRVSHAVGFLTRLSDEHVFSNKLRQCPENIFGHPISFHRKKNQGARSTCPLRRTYTIIQQLWSMNECDHVSAGTNCSRLVHKNCCED